MTEAPSRPLSGVRVVDLTSQLSGPYCTWLLAALGADVIKVERPAGDPARATGPFVGVGEESLYFTSINRGKRSVVLDLKTDEGAARLETLIRTSDVLVENMRPGALARLGFPAERVAELNPRLVFASISGFGQDGPLSDRPAFDVVVQAMSGLMSITGPEGGEPVRTGVSIGDIAAGLFAALDIVANLFARGRGGAPARVDTSMLDCQLALMENAIGRCLNTGELPGPIGTRHPSVAPFQAFPTSDGTIVIAVDNDATWTRMCRATGLDELLADDRFAGAGQRLRNHAALAAALAAHLRRRPSAAWLDALVAAGVPCGPLSSVPEALASAQVEARGMVVEVEGWDGTPLRFVAAPVGRRDARPAPAPRLGEHTAEVLDELVVAEGDRV